MNDSKLIQEGLRHRAFQALVDGDTQKGYQLLDWARELDK